MENETTHPAGEAPRAENPPIHVEMGLDAEDIQTTTTTGVFADDLEDLRERAGDETNPVVAFFDGFRAGSAYGFGIAIPGPFTTDMERSAALIDLWHEVGAEIARAKVEETPIDTTDGPHKWPQGEARERRDRFYALLKEDLGDGDHPSEVAWGFYRALEAVATGKVTGGDAAANLAVVRMVAQDALEGK